MTRPYLLSTRSPVAWGFLALSGLVAEVSPARAQDSTRVTLTPVQVTVTRDAARSPLELPFGLTRLSIEGTRPATRRATLTELLQFVPGVAVSHRYNPTQDPRLAVRGFGARSAFGIRGVRVLRDGIPLTVADGQTAIDFMDLETIGAAEVIRGSAGALYGNSSGGVLDFRTEAADSAWRARGRGFYADGITRLSGHLAGPLGPIGTQVTVTHNDGEGPRDYSQFRNTSVLGDARWNLGGMRLQAQLSLYDSPLAENPGALTAVEMDTNRTMADPNNVRRGASKTVQHTAFALQAARDGERGSFNANVQVGARDLENPQTFAIVAFERATYGASARGQYVFGETRSTLRVTAGADFLSQDDDRQNFTNCHGLTPRPATCPATGDQGPLTLDQRERVQGLGAYTRAEWMPADQWSFTGMLRGDRTRFSVLDHRAAVPDEQARTLSAVTPMVGVNWRLSTLSSLYANVSSSFETPTTTELANQPDGSGGLNTELKPQRGLTYEVGAKGFFTTGVTYDASVFRIDTKDELIPFEIVGGGGRRFFRNAGKTLRYGAELGTSVTRGMTSLGLSATWLKYTYEEFTVSGTDYAGNRVPGVAPGLVSASVTVRPKLGLAALELQHVGRTPADDANNNYADAYDLLNLRVALSSLERFGVQPVIGVDNLLDETYAANIVANAANGRFYEPGPGRTVWFALTLGNRAR
jgi:iron complex outermembrane recepter protein